MQNLLAFQTHDHGRCRHKGLAHARAHCAREGLRLTPVRERVLEILLSSHRAMGAYEVLEILKAEDAGDHPPVAYRALDFLTANGFAHRVERLNAYVACAVPGPEHDPAFLICRICGTVAETQAPSLPAEGGFESEQQTLEIEGRCPGCRETEE